MSCTVPNSYVEVLTLSTLVCGLSYMWENCRCVWLQRNNTWKVSWLPSLWEGAMWAEKSEMCRLEWYCHKPGNRHLIIPSLVVLQGGRFWTFGSPNCETMHSFVLNHFVVFSYGSPGNSYKNQMQKEETKSNNLFNKKRPKTFKLWSGIFKILVLDIQKFVGKLWIPSSIHYA